MYFRWLRRIEQFRPAAGMSKRHGRGSNSHRTWKWQTIVVYINLCQLEIKYDTKLPSNCFFFLRLNLIYNCFRLPTKRMRLSGWIPARPLLLCVLWKDLLYTLWGNKNANCLYCNIVSYSSSSWTNLKWSERAIRRSCLGRRGRVSPQLVRRVAYISFHYLGTCGDTLWPNYKHSNIPITLRPDADGQLDNSRIDRVKDVVINCLSVKESFVRRALRKNREILLIFLWIRFQPLNFLLNHIQCTMREVDEKRVGSCPVRSSGCHEIICWQHRFPFYLMFSVIKIKCSSINYFPI